MFSLKGLDMVQPIEQITKQVLSLSASDRAQLLHALLHSLDIPEQPTSELDCTLDRRAEELRSGNVKGIPAEQVHREMREKYF